MMSDDALSSIKPFLPQPIPNPNLNPNPNPNPNPAKRKRNQPGTPDPDAEVIALSPKSLMATNRFICEICNKGFQRDQNLQLHRRGHNLPWKLKQRTSKEVRKKVYICPEKSCVHHEPSRALGDLTGIKKHYSRKHGEKKWKCEKCSKKYAVQSDWKAHSKICGTREYKCDCGTLFSRKDSFITHRAFCDALAEESARFNSSVVTATNLNFGNDLMGGSISTDHMPQAAGNPQFSATFRPDFVGIEASQHNMDGQKTRLPMWLDHANSYPNHVGMAANPNAYFVSNSELAQLSSTNMLGLSSQWLNRGQDAPFNGANLSSLAMPGGPKVEEENKTSLSQTMSSLYYNNPEAPAHISATALLQKAAQMGSTRSNSAILGSGFGLMTSSLSNLTSFNSLNQNRNEVQKFNGDGLLLGEVSSGSVVGDGTGNLDRLMLIPNNGKQGRPGCNEAERSMTRDFLGVGGGDELAKFASMGSAMDLSQYNGSH